MKSMRWTFALVLVALFAVAAIPGIGPQESEAAAQNEDQSTAFFSGGFEFGSESSDPLFSSQGTCHITCADGGHHHREADDIDECVDACNEVCETTTCQPA